MPEHTPTSIAAAAAICVVLSAMTSTHPSLAAPAAPSEAPEATTVAAAEAFDVARRLWEARDYTTALPLFERALASSGSPNARLYVARCLRDLGRLPEAYEQMRRTVDDARALAETEERYVATRDAAAAELVLLEPRVAKVVVALDERMADAAVTINGSPVARERLGQPIAVLPGRVRVSAAPPAGAPVTRELDATGGRVVTVTLSAAPVTPTAPAEPVATGSEEDSGGEDFGVARGVGIAVMAIGVAGLVTFGVERAQADAEIETLEQECGAGPCTDPSYGDVVDRGKTAEAVSVVGLAVGIAGLLAGTAMVVFGGPADAAAESAWAPTTQGVRFRF